MDDVLAMMLEGPEAPGAPGAPGAQGRFGNAWALFAFVAQGPHELTVEAGQPVQWEYEVEGWACVAVQSGEAGLVPSTYLKKRGGGN